MSGHISNINITKDGEGVFKFAEVLSPTDSKTVYIKEIREGNKIKGVLCVYFPQTGAFTPFAMAEETEEHSYITDALNKVRKNFACTNYFKGRVPRVRIKLAAKYRKDILDNAELKCPIQADYTENLEDVQSIFHDCEFLEEFFTEEPKEKPKTS